MRPPPTTRTIAFHRIEGSALCRSASITELGSRFTRHLDECALLIGERRDFQDSRRGSTIGIDHLRTVELAAARWRRSYERRNDGGHRKRTSITDSASAVRVSETIPARIIPAILPVRLVNTHAVATKPPTPFARNNAVLGHRTCHGATKDSTRERVAAGKDNRLSMIIRAQVITRLPVEAACVPPVGSFETRLAIRKRIHSETMKTAAISSIDNAARFNFV